jgi:hypothetical protein
MAFVVTPAKIVATSTTESPACVNLSSSAVNSAPWNRWINGRAIAQFESHQEHKEHQPQLADHADNLSCLGGEDVGRKIVSESTQKRVAGEPPSQNLAHDLWLTKLTHEPSANPCRGNDDGKLQQDQEDDSLYLIRQP